MTKIIHSLFISLALIASSPAVAAIDTTKATKHLLDANGDGVKDEKFYQGRLDVILIPMDDILIPIVKKPAVYGEVQTNTAGVIKEFNASSNPSEAVMENNSIVHIADSNGDGKDDILLQGKSSSGRIYLLLAPTYNVAQEWGNGYLGLDWTADRASIQFADFNGDLHADLRLKSTQTLYSDFTDTTVTTVYATNNGSFTAASKIEEDVTLKYNVKSLVAGKVKGSFDVSPSGAGTYTVPITVPPGINGMQPKLSLNYNSQRGNGHLGVGWSIGGLSQITRCPTTLGQDGFIDGVDFDDNDRFCLDGKRLVAVSGAYGAPGTEYRTEIESYAKIISNGTSGSGPESFTVWTKSGHIVEYGHTPDSRIEAQGRADILTWAINKKIDTSGNYIHYAYIEDNPNGEYMINQINYTGNGNRSPLFSVQFNYAARKDQIIRFRGGSKVAINQLLLSIETYQIGSDAPIKRYAITHDYSTASVSSRINKLYECDSGNHCIQPIQFSYDGTDVIPKIGKLTMRNAKDFTGLNWKTYTGDFDGNGLTDIYFVVDGSGQNRLYLNNGRNIDTIVDDPISRDELKVTGPIIHSGDYDGDGTTDLLFHRSDTGVNRLYLGGEDGSFNYSGGPLNATDVSGTDVEVNTGDFDGNGLTDILFYWNDGTGTNRLYLSNGDGTFQYHSNPLNAPDESDQTDSLRIKTGDFNGDGLTDIFFYWGDNHINRLHLSRGDGTFYFYSNPLDVTDVTDGVLPLVETGDFNGDGLKDIFYLNRKTGHNRIYLNRGDGTFQDSIEPISPDVLINPGISIAPVVQIFISELNGDGLDDLDIVVRGGSDGSDDFSYKRTYFESRGDGTFIKGYSRTYVTYTAHNGVKLTKNFISAGDFNGNGLTDVVYSRYSYVNYTPSLHVEVLGNIYEYRTYKQFPKNLTAISDSFGVQLSIDYSTLADQAVYSKYYNGERSTYPIRNIQSSMSVVSSYSKSDGLDGTYSYAYLYAGAKADIHRRQFLGFRSTKKIDNQLGIKKQTIYNQTFPTTGRVDSSTSTYAHATLGDIELSRITNTYNNFGTYNNSVYVVEKTGGSSISKELDGSDISSSITTVNRQYDANNTPITMSTETVWSDGYSKQTINNLYNDYLNWRLGQLTCSTATKMNPLPSVDQIPTSMTRRSGFAYDPITGLPVKEVTEPSAADDCITPTALSVVTDYGYDSFGNKTSTAISGTGITTRTSTVSYDANGLFPISQTNNLSHSETMAYDARFGVMTSQTGPNDITTRWEYDSFGRKLSEFRDDGSSTTIDYILCDVNTLCNDILQSSIGSPLAVRTIESTGEQSTVYFDILGRSILDSASGFDGRMVLQKTTYDSYGRISSRTNPYYQSNPEGALTQYEYDVLGRATVIHKPDTSQSTVTYQGLTTITTNGKEQESTTVKNSQGHLVASTDAMSNSVTYKYDPLGNLRTTTDAHGNKVTMGYDLMGRKTSMDDPDMGQWSYEYDVLGNLVKQIDNKGQITTMTYDTLDRMVTQTEPEGSTTWAYDSAPNGIGKLASVSSPGYQRIQSYDSLSRPSSTSTTIDGAVYTFSTTYEVGAGRVLTNTYPSGYTVKNIYNSFGALSEKRNAANDALLWQAHQANAFGQIYNEDFGANGLKSIRTYDSATKRLRAIATGINGGWEVQRLAYNYDTLGNLEERRDDNQSLTETFTYDDLNRLLSATIAGVGTKTYQYDAIGNIKNKSDVSATDFVYGQGGAGPHAVTNADGLSYSYDANGNMISGDGRNLTYTSFNKPLTVSKDTVNNSYYYDAEHERMKKVSIKGAVVTTTTYLGKDYEVVQKSSGITEYKHYITVGSGTFQYTTRSDATTESRYLLTDHLGSTDVITDENGVAVERLSFGPYGQWRNPNWAVTTSITSTITNRGYTSHEMDDEVGLINMNARMYDPKLGRFLSPDSLVPRPDFTQSYNRYTYALNNPLRYTDPTGMYEDDGYDYDWDPDYDWDDDYNLGSDYDWDYSGYDDWSDYDLSFDGVDYGMTDYSYDPFIVGDDLNQAVYGDDWGGHDLGGWVDDSSSFSLADTILFTLDLASASEIPVISQVAGFGSAFGYALQGDNVGATLAMAGMVPGAGLAADAARLGRWGGKGLAGPGEDLFVGTYNQVRRGNLKSGLNTTHTPHHVVQNAVSTISHGRGITINIQKNLHAQTRTFRKPVETGLDLRTHLARDVKDLRNILGNAGYNRSSTNRQMRELIGQNKNLWAQ